MAGAWTAPSTWTPGLVVTDVMLNAQLRDNMLWLGGTAGAITQNTFQAGVSSGPTTASASPAFVDLPDLSTGITTAGGDLIAIAIAQVSNSTVNDGVNMALSLDAASEVGSTGMTSATANASACIVAVWRWSAPSAGAHTVKARWNASGGGTAASTGTNRLLLLLELRR